MESKEVNDMVIIGAGPTSLYVLKHLGDNSKYFQKFVKKIVVIEKNKEPGMGFPFNPQTTDVHNLANICCEEIPDLSSCLTDWLSNQEAEKLQRWNIDKSKLKKDQLHCRIAIGDYFKEQFKVICKNLEQNNIIVEVKSNTEATDIIPSKNNQFKIQLQNKKAIHANKVIIATGHKWVNEDIPEKKYFSSPWPMNKLLPNKEDLYNFPVGLLGASLSAFDVVTSLAHRHGTFEGQAENLKFIKNPKAPNFKIILHASQGWLPHLQYEQKEARRKVYRHVSREELLNHRNNQGFLRLSEFYKQVAKPALLKALKKDKKTDLMAKMKEPNFSFQEVVDHLANEHTYINSFQGLKKELKIATKKINQGKPTYWMETLDDLMYTLNFHADLLCAEDHIFLKENVFSFLMNVIAALPLQSAHILLALYEAEVIQLVEGRVTILKDKKYNKYTSIQIEDDQGNITTEKYEMFVNCAGQHTTSAADYPFPTLIDKQIITNAIAVFCDEDKAKKYKAKTEDVNLVENKESTRLQLGGIKIDSFFRVVDHNNKANPNLYDISLAHISGARPYSYGLQACDAVAAIVVEALQIKTNKKTNEVNIEKATAVYKEEI